jgi:hypothetical protein
MDKTEVTPAEIMKPAGGETDSKVTLQKLSPIQEAGMRIALYTGVLITLVTFTVVILWLTTAPPLPPETSADAATGKAALETYKALNDLAIERSTKLFDLIVVKALLPVFTASLGYIFGTRASEPGS